MAALGLSCGMQTYSPHVIRNLCSQTKNRNHIHYIGKQIFNHWTTREVPLGVYFREKCKEKILSVWKTLTKLTQICK